MNVHDQIDLAQDFARTRNARLATCRSRTGEIITADQYRAEVWGLDRKTNTEDARHFLGWLKTERTNSTDWSDPADVRALWEYYAIDYAPEQPTEPLTLRQFLRGLARVFQADPTLFRDVFRPESEENEADPRKIIGLLSLLHPGETFSNTELAALLGCSMSAASKQLTRMQTAGRIMRVKRGKTVAISLGAVPQSQAVARITYQEAA